MKPNRKRRRCYWCRATGATLTNDHVVPLGFGGSDDDANQVRACDPCNQERGQIVGAYLNLFTAAQAGHPEKSQRRCAAHLAAMRPLVEKWGALERLRMGGRSVSDRLGTAAHPFPATPCRRAGTMEAACEEARRVAETRAA
jgi:hypothetical protein